MGFKDAKIYHPPKYLPIKELFEVDGFEKIHLTIPEQPEPIARDDSVPDEKKEYDILVYCYEHDMKYTLTLKNGGRNGLSQVFENVHKAYMAQKGHVVLKAKYNSSSKYYAYYSKFVEAEYCPT